MWSRITTPSSVIMIEGPPTEAILLAKKVTTGLDFEEASVSEVAEAGVSKFLRDNPGTVVIRKAYVEARS